MPALDQGLFNCSIFVDQKITFFKTVDNKILHGKLEQTSLPSIISSISWNKNFSATQMAQSY